MSLVTSLHIPRKGKCSYPPEGLSIRQYTLPQETRHVADMLFTLLAFLHSSRVAPTEGAPSSVIVLPQIARHGQTEGRALPLASSGIAPILLTMRTRPCSLAKHVPSPIVTQPNLAITSTPQILLILKMSGGFLCHTLLWGRVHAQRRVFCISYQPTNSSSQQFKIVCQMPKKWSKDVTMIVRKNLHASARDHK